MHLFLAKIFISDPAKFHPKGMFTKGNGDRVVYILLCLLWNIWTAQSLLKRVPFFVYNSCFCFVKPKGCLKGLKRKNDRGYRLKANPFSSRSRPMKVISDVPISRN